MRSIARFTVFVATALLLVACGGNQDSAELQETVNQTINVVLNDIYFGESNENASNPPVWNVSNGANVTVILDNQGTLQHNWAIVRAGQEAADRILAAHRDGHRGVLDL